MAHHTTITGRISELKAEAALASNGWEVSRPSVAEVYDLVGRNTETGEWATFQCKTIRKRTDRNNEMVIYTSKGNGQPYTKEDCDYIIGVDGDRVFMTECRGIKEMWVSEATVAEKWTELTAQVSNTESEAV